DILKPRRLVRLDRSLVVRDDADLPPLPGVDVREHVLRGEADRGLLAHRGLPEVRRPELPDNAIQRAVLRLDALDDARAGVGHARERTRSSLRWRSRSQ